MRNWNRHSQNALRVVLIEYFIYLESLVGSGNIQRADWYYCQVLQHHARKHL
jgi:hypothetical protein